MDDAFSYVVKNGGIDSEDDYSYWSSWGLPFSWCNKWVAGGAGQLAGAKGVRLPWGLPVPAAQGLHVGEGEALP
jgi:hypothetical protein